MNEQHGVEKALQEAVARHRAGDLAGAAEGYRSVLARAPDNADALHLLGLIACRQGDPQRGIELIGQAIDRMPRHAPFYSSLANAHRAAGAPERAAAALERALEIHPSETGALISLGILHHEEGHHDEAIAAFERALHADPRSADAHNNLGISCRLRGELAKAVECFLAAIDLDPEHGGAHNNLGLALQEYEAYAASLLGAAASSYRRALSRIPQAGDAERNLRALYRRMVPRWHFAMLNDAERNDAYDRVLRSLVEPGALVLDIGAGSGLLAMMAVRAGAGRVVTCEMVEPLAEKAAEIVARNAMSDRITVVAKESTQLLVGSDLPERADLMVTEIFDAGLIGEHALSVIADARARLLAPGAPVIPRGATLYAVLIESESLWRKDRVGTVSGFDLSPFNAFSTWPHYLQVQLMHHEHRYLSEPFEALSFDFAADDPKRPPRNLTIEAIEDGECHGVAYWYRLDLGAEVVTDTAPRDEDSHWQQAFQPLAEPRRLARGETLALTVHHDDRALSFEVGEAR